MSEWKEYTLGELLVNYDKQRKPLSAIQRASFKGNYRYYGAQGVIDYVNDYIFDGDYMLIAEDGENLNSRNAPIAQLVSGKFWVNNHAHIVKTNDKADMYLLMLMLNYTNISAYVTGAAQPKLNQDNLNRITLSLPPIADQRRISSILSSLDDKIAVNRRICENLEAQAQALFKNWFVDFAPFKNGKFVESELGMIPEGWRVDKIRNIQHTLETGKRPKGGIGQITCGIPSVGAENVKGLGIFDYSRLKYITEDFASKQKKGWVNGYELLMYKDGGTPGNFVPHYTIFGEGFPLEKFCLNEHVFKLDFENRAYNTFAYFFFQTPRVEAYLKAVGGKAAIPGINQQNVEDIYILTPDNEAVMEFGNKVLPMIKAILINSKESSRLSTLRDTLLPKLMSGKIEI